MADLLLTPPSNNSSPVNPFFIPARDGLKKYNLASHEIRLNSIWLFFSYLHKKICSARTPRRNT
jgi:hypothetical protein